MLIGPLDICVVANTTAGEIVAVVAKALNPAWSEATACADVSWILTPGMNKPPVLISAMVALAKASLNPLAIPKLAILPALATLVTIAFITVLPIYLATNVSPPVAKACNTSKPNSEVAEIALNRVVEKLLGLYGLYGLSSAIDLLTSTYLLPPYLLSS